VPKVTAHLSISLDGYVAGPDQSLDQPLGRNGHAVHRWHMGDVADLHEVDRRFAEELLRPKGAVVMGRNMFGPVRGGWDTWAEDWRGWWGEEPPYHAPVFVLTHHEREPLELTGTTFYFVTGGFEEAMDRAREAAGDDDVDIAGGASAVRQGLVAGVVDELVLAVAPVLLGGGESIFAGVPDPGFTPLEVAQSPTATHVRYRVGG
jgi:dihydrofolate reductase